MSITIYLSIFLLNTKIISSSYLKAESNYLKPLSERNNIVNKGVWVRNPKDKIVTQSNFGNFIFRANSLDADSLLQNNFDTFGDNDMQDTPDVFGYVERTKRETNYERKDLLRENIKDCNDDDCALKNTAEKSYVKSKLMSKLKPASVFNDYPYEVAILLGDNKLDDDIAINKVRKVKESGDLNTVIPLSRNGTPKVNIESFVQVKSDVETMNTNDNNNSVVTPKRSMKNEYDSAALKQIDIAEDLNDDNYTSKVDRGIFDKDDRVWHQNVPDTTYKVSPKYPKTKLINERGLIKVLSMLTKTFKKIMKQHNDIRKIHSKLHEINNEVNRNTVDMAKKYQDIEEKYAYILSVSEKIKSFEANMNVKEEYFKTKDREMSKNLVEFENQQKKFLSQQRQFYSIQKLMLAQNEKINIKQNLIAKTQSEISHRQNNFARILKKAKQIYIDNKQQSNRIPTSTFRPILNETEEINKITHTTTSSPFTTESIKINLFSIPTLNKLVNHDLQILKEKDEQPVDDLVYKYYFNNTFIDNFMKNKVLSSFVTTPENAEIARNAKNKRQEDKLETTILLPINKTENQVKHRERRWIRHRHQSKAKLKKSAKHSSSNQKFNDDKPLRPKSEVVLQPNRENLMTKLFSKNRNNPFLVMAKSFCNEIGQNLNEQMLNWCVEKSLRRLQVIDSKIPFSFPTSPETTKMNSSNQDQKTTSSSINKESTAPPIGLTGSSVSPGVISSTIPTLASKITAEPKQTNIVFFPDNDELESNLKEFDLKPDTEGTVYYAGSLHASDYAGLAGTTGNSEGLSDIIPSLDSNSRVDVDPLTFNLQERRRDTVRRINENIIKRLYG